MKATKAILMGYGPTGYRLWDNEKRRIFIGRNVTFDENVCFAKMPFIDAYEEDVEVKGGNHSKEDAKDLSEEESNESRIQDEAEEGNEIPCDKETMEQAKPKRSERERKPSRYGECYTHYLEADAFCALNAEQYVQGIPTNLTEAKESPDWAEWKEAITSELKSLEKNSTWTLTQLPKGRKSVQNKGFFVSSSIQKETWKDSMFDW